MNRAGLSIGIAGGLGLGLLIGSGFPGRITTIAGAAILVVVIILMIVLSFLGRKQERRRKAS